MAGVLADGRALDEAVDHDRAGLGRHGLVEELSIGTIRHAYTLQALAAPFLRRPLKKADQDIYALILIGLYQARLMGGPAPVAVSEAVATVEALGKPWARGLVNAVLRAALDSPPAEDPTQNHPAWLVSRLQAAWPEDWQAILRANDGRAPLTLRVDTSRLDRDTYQRELAQAGIVARPHALAPGALILASGVPVTTLPGFSEGLVSVQDAAAQLAAPLLEAGPGQRVLDACAAPGGKTGHIAQSAPGAHITATDRDPLRVIRLQETLARLKCRQVRVETRDLACESIDEPFDRILLDAPCSATGIIRRHPDIKLRRRPADIEELRTTQRRLLDALWKNLVPGGWLLYVTCSVLPEENEEQVAGLLNRARDARESPLSFPVGHRRMVGWQFLPGEEEMDGFYYARLEKRA